MTDSQEQYLHDIVSGIVQHPDHIHIERTLDEQGVLLTMSLHPDDMGKVIGRSGATAKAIRTILRAMGMAQNARVSLKILEPVAQGSGTISEI